MSWGDEMLNELFGLLRCLVWRELAARSVEWRKCQFVDEKYFFENYWFIAHPAYGRILFALREAQKKALEEWAEQ